jgi:RNA polymerase sigma-70 factor (ECF subfamily)
MARGVTADEHYLALYDRHAEHVLTFLMRRTLDPEIARDLWAECWAVAYQRWDRLRSGASSAEQEAWVYAIARNLLNSYYRRGKAEQRARRRLGLERPPLSEVDVERLIRLARVSELRERLNVALRGLPSAQRDAIALRVGAELPYDEVAVRLGVSEPVARARVSRGLRALRIVLTDLAVDELRTRTP